MRIENKIEQTTDSEDADDNEAEKDSGAASLDAMLAESKT